MPASLTITNNYSHDVYMMAAERPLYQIADLLADAAEIASGISELRAALTAGLALPEAVTTVKDLWACLKAAQQIQKMALAPIGMYDAAERLWTKLTGGNSVLVPAGKTVNVLDESRLREFCTPAGLLGLVHANTLNVVVVSSEKNAVINFESDIPDTWVLNQVGIAKESGDAQYDWNGVAATTSRVSMATVGVTTVVAWRDKSSSVWTMSLLGGFWQSPIRVPHDSADGPAITTFRNQLWLVARGSGNDEGLWYSTFANGAWSDAQPIGARSRTAPSMVEFNDQLLVFFLGDDGRINLTAFDTPLQPNQWSPPSPVPALNTPVGVGAVTHAGNLYLAWSRAQGTGHDQNMWYLSSAAGPIFGGKPIQMTGMGSAVGPALCDFDGRVYAAWRGSGEDQSLWFSSFDGTQWAPQQQIPNVGSSIGPAIAADGTTLGMFAAWPGAGTDDAIYYTDFDGETWSPQQLVWAMS